MGHSEDFKVEFNTELNKLKEFVETRKTSLEEEIEETLHLAIANAKDSLELIQKNIDPKVEKIIQNKMEYIDNKMENWKKDFRYVAQEEIKTGSEELTKKTLENLDGIIEEKKKMLKEELSLIVHEEIRNLVEPGFQKTATDIKNVKNKILMSIGLTTLALVGILTLHFFL